MIDKALHYAQDVVDGKEITPNEVIQQCKWFLDDYEKKQYNDDFPYYFDVEEVEKIEGILSILTFATGFLAGKSLLDGLVGFQAFFIANIFGWRFKNEPEKFRYKDVTLFIPRKNGKTFLASICILLLLLTQDDYSELYSISKDRELAGETKKQLMQLINESPILSKHFTTSTTLNGKIKCSLTNSFYQARTADASRNNAIRPLVVIADEIGAFTDYNNINAMKSGQLSVRNPLIMKLTTAYPEDKSIMLEELSYIKRVYAGLIQDDRMFALLYYADKDNLWTDRGLEMANPLRIPQNYEEIRDSRRKAIEKPLERVEYLCKHVNHFLPSQAGEAFINVDDLRKCKIDNFDWFGRQVWLGLDLAMTNDNCSYSMVTEEDGKIFVDSYAFIPEDRVDEKNRTEKINYHEFIQAGKCYACGDMTVDYVFIEDVIMQVENRFGVSVAGIAYDRYNCLSTAQKLDREGYKVVEVKQHSSVLHPATKLLKEKIMSQEFHYTENKLLEINFQNARAVEDANKNLYVNKKKSNGKVDMVVSLINAIYLLQQDVIFNPESDWGAMVI